MHRSLLLEEITQHIFEALHAAGKLSTLTSLAVTCKWFHESALDVLWKEIYDLAHLVKCFPADAWFVEFDQQTSSTTLKMTRPLMAQDWTAVLTYANRIKTLRYDYGMNKLDPNVLQALLAFRPILILFPKLHTLEWGEGLSNLPAMITLIGPELKALETFTESSSSEDDIGVMKFASAYIGARCPNLESITFNYYLGQTPAGVLGVDSLVTSSKRLQHFACAEVSCSQSSLLALAKSENLLELSLRLPNGMRFPVSMGFETFPALRDLIIDGDFRECLNFFEAMDLTRLETLDVEVGLLHDHPNIRLLFTAFRFGPDHTRMTSINLYIVAEPSASMSLFSSDDIRLLLVLRNLRKVTISAETFTCEGSFYQDMATAWPHLVTLCVVMASEAPIASALTPFATHCPQLEYLTLSCNVDGRNLTADYIASLGLFGGGSSQSKVITLVIWTSMIQCPENVVAFLLHLFPGIQWVDGSRQSGGDRDRQLQPAEYNRRWDEVRRYIPILRQCILRDRRSRTGTAGHRTPLADSVL